MGMDCILKKEGENEGRIVKIERKISTQGKGNDGILSKVSCLECKRIYRDLLVCKRKHGPGKNLLTYSMEQSPS
jgi:hypothetical protein